MIAGIAWGTLRASHEAMNFALRQQWVLSLVVAVSAAVPIGVSGRARADCEPPEFEVVWSYPEDGARDVPTDARLFLITSDWGATSGTWALNGTELTFEPGAVLTAQPQLEPDTDYTLRFVAQPTEPVSSDVSFELMFRTGTAQSVAPTSPTVEGYATVSGFAGYACPDVIAAQDCFDTGQDTLLTFEASSPGALAYNIRDSTGEWVIAFVPASCGDPGAYLHSQTLPGCYGVSAIGTDGSESQATTFCVGEQSEPEAGSGTGVDTDGRESSKTKESSGCSALAARADASRQGIALWLTMAAFFLRRRERAQNRLRRSFTTGAQAQRRSA